MNTAPRTGWLLETGAKRGAQGHSALLVLALALMSAGGCATSCPPCDCPGLIPAEIHDARFVTSALVKEGPFVVRWVTDGDTLKLDNGETIRLIGVDTPETKHPELPVQRFGKEASAYTKKTCMGKTVYVEYYAHEKYDKYNRLLAYVWLGDKMLNAELLARGYAYVYRRYPFSRKAEFIALENKARAEQRGLWNHGLRDGRYTRLVETFDALNGEGKAELDKVLDELMARYPVKTPPPAEYPVPDEPPAPEGTPETTPEEEPAVAPHN